MAVNVDQSANYLEEAYHNKEANRQQWLPKYKKHSTYIDKTTNINTNYSNIFARRECTSCLEYQTLDQYDANYNRKCSHIRRTICNQCVYKHVIFTLQDGSKTTAKCPEPRCKREFSYESILEILTIGNNKRLIDQYDLAVTRKYLEKMPGFIWCAHPGCNSGQIHDINIRTRCQIICIECKRATCSFHRTIWHRGLTCEEYDRKDPVANWIHTNAKQCPQCGRNIQKNGGCHHMKCSQCGHEFCWECLANFKDITRIGLQKHAKTCSHYKPLPADLNPIHPTRSCIIL